MNVRTSSVDLKELKDAIQTRRNASLPVDVIIPICVGFDWRRDKAKAGELESIIERLTNDPAFVDCHFQIRLYENKADKQKVADWYGYNQKATDYLASQNIVFRVDDWRVLNQDARTHLRAKFKSFLLANAEVAKEYDQLLGRDASEFISKRKSKSGRKLSDIEVDALIKEAKNYIEDEIIDCLYSLPALDDPERFSIFLYSDTFYASMRYILKEKHELLGCAKLEQVNYGLIKDKVVAAAPSIQVEEIADLVVVKLMEKLPQLNQLSQLQNIAQFLQLISHANMTAMTQGLLASTGASASSTPVSSVNVSPESSMNDIDEDQVDAECSSGSLSNATSLSSSPESPAVVAPVPCHPNQKFFRDFNKDSSACSTNISPSRLWRSAGAIPRDSEQAVNENILFGKGRPY